MVHTWPAALATSWNPLTSSPSNLFSLLLLAWNAITRREKTSQTATFFLQTTGSCLKSVSLGVSKCKSEAGLTLHGLLLISGSAPLCRCTFILLLLLLCCLVHYNILPQIIFCRWTKKETIQYSRRQPGSRHRYCWSCEKVSVVQQLFDQLQTFAAYLTYIWDDG